MKIRQGYKGYVIVARSCELQDGDSQQSSQSRNMLRMSSRKLSSTCPTPSPRKSPRLRQQFKLGGRKLTRVSSGDRQSRAGEPSRARQE